MYTATFVWTDKKYLEFGLKIIKMMWFLYKFTFILNCTDAAWIDKELFKEYSNLLFKK